MGIAIFLRPFYYSGKDFIAILGIGDVELAKRVKPISGALWSDCNNCWYIPCTRWHYEKLCMALKNWAIPDTSELKLYLEQKNSIIKAAGKRLTWGSFRALTTRPVRSLNLPAFAAFRNMLVLKGYSVNTIRQYCGEFQFLLRLLGERDVNSLTRDEVLSYLLWLLQKNRYSETRVHSAVNAIKFYFEKVLDRATEFYEIPRPRKPFLLPDVLAEVEVAKLLKGVMNIKHRALLMAAYSAGLRVSELVGLRIWDIDAKRMMVHVRRGKGKKDRMVPLSRLLLDTLREYYKIYKPKEYLFEGMEGGAYSVRSVQMILAQAKARAGILKRGSVHSLRHSFATHLMENGTDIRIIQELMGHNSIQTTMRYTHISKKDIGKIESPLDRLKWE